MSIVGSLIEFVGFMRPVYIDELQSIDHWQKRICLQLFLFFLSSLFSAVWRTTESHPTYFLLRSEATPGISFHAAAAPAVRWLTIGN